MANSYWFRHDYASAEDEKLIPLLRKLGWQGYGIYWRLIEKLHVASNSLEKNYEDIAYDMRTQCELIKSVVEDFKLFRVNEKTFSSDRVAKNLKEKEEKSQKAKESAERRWSKDANAMQT